MALHKQVESTTTKESDQYHQQDGNQNSSLSYIEEKLKTTDSVLQSTKDTLEVMRKKYEDKIKSHEDNIKQLERRISSQCTSQVCVLHTAVAPAHSTSMSTCMSNTT